ncbi:hypothetical protein GCM10007414_03340 [Agarivorans gilvus]|uniref:Uncharacterized protein n=1 Tax=Agarivorans gilvus TaxID=680279 RepID=A0ABQ1HWR9_9ALTE|nr:hypothetical protein GCM10007414_03340 [Agarivorans gilvus]
MSINSAKIDDIYLLPIDQVKPCSKKKITSLCTKPLVFVMTKALPPETYR